MMLTRFSGLRVLVAAGCALAVTATMPTAPVGPNTSAAAATPAPASAALTAALRSVAASGGPGSYGTSTLGRSGWQVRSSAAVPDGGKRISTAGYSTVHWLAVQPDDAGAPGTEIEALLQNGACPNVFYSDTMRQCFGTQPKIGKETVAQFAVPWWYRTTFTAPPAGRQAELVVNGIVGQADVWVDGTEVATAKQVRGAYTQYRFDVTKLLHRGTNAVALKVHPNNPNSMFTVDNVDWTQIAPDQNTGIQFPVQLQTSTALGLTDVHVVQHDATDLSTAALTVVGRVTNHSSTAQSGTVSALVVDPTGRHPVFVSEQVTVAAATTAGITLTPERHPALVLHHPQVWWPYQMGAQPLYTVVAALSAHGMLVDSATEHVGIRSVTSRLVAGSPLAPGGVRQYAINGRPFVVRGGGFDPDLFLHYSSADTAHQIQLIKGMGLNTLRLEGHFMPPDFYDQMDRAGILVAAGFQCCDAWEMYDPPTPDQVRILQLSAVSVAQRQRDHASVFTFQWSDQNPTDEQEAVTLAAFRDEGFDVPVVASAEYRSSPQLGLAGEKEGPYDWVPPSYWYDRTHSDYADDNSLTNVGGAWGLDSEQSAGHTIPTVDSMRRFMSPEDQAKLWQDPKANQYHANPETGLSGYNFGTLFNFDTALSNRYGAWTGLTQYTQEAQLQNYEDVRAQFEAFIDNWTQTAAPSTGTIYWMANKGWPTLLWDLYNYDYDEAGSYFGAQEANRTLHAFYVPGERSVTLDNLGGRTAGGLTVQARVWTLDGTVLDDRTAGGISLTSQQVRNGVLSVHVPARTSPGQPASVYFVEVLLRKAGTVVDRNVYWESTQPDVVNWGKTEGNPQATMRQYADLRALQGLPAAAVRVQAHSSGAGATERTVVTVTNTSPTKTVALFLRADVRRGDRQGRAQPGDNQVRPVTWSSNDITLWPGESETLTATYARSELHGARPVVSLYGWNAGEQVVTAD
jgi:exo-1,4-beta-D-glucosaminidase